MIKHNFHVAECSAVGSPGIRRAAHGLSMTDILGVAARTTWLTCGKEMRVKGRYICNLQHKNEKE
jgi:hypothetical protein